MTGLQWLPAPAPFLTTWEAEHVSPTLCGWKREYLQLRKGVFNKVNDNYSQSCVLPDHTFLCPKGKKSKVQSVFEQPRGDIPRVLSVHWNTLTGMSALTPP